MRDDELFGGWSDESIQRLAGYAARVTHNKTLMHGTRREIAIGAMVDFLCEWVLAEPAPALDLLKAAHGAIDYESYHYRRDHGYISGTSSDVNTATWGFQTFWIKPPATVDAMAEGVAERIGIWQALEALPPWQRKAVRALADAIGDGSDYHAAAARLGLSETSMKTRLYLARRTIRQLWLADDEHPRGKWGYERGPNKSTKSIVARTLRTRKGRKDSIHEGRRRIQDG
jgi:DNA-directed RNA polymerase specialized sigma24 family protein